MSEEQRVVVSAPGKVILFGEHSVVYGKPAVAAALGLRTQVTLTRTAGGSPTVDVELPDIEVAKTWSTEDLAQFTAAHGVAGGADTPLDTPTPPCPDYIAALSAAFLDPEDHAAIAAFLYLYLAIGCSHHCSSGAPAVASAHVVAKSQLPIGAGLGSSAAFSVCLAGAILRASDGPAADLDWTVDPESGKVPDATLDVINKWAFAAEVVIHGTPSGVDNTVSTFGAAVRFKAKVPSPVQLPSISLLLVDTRVPRSTSGLVAGVRAKRNALPAVMDPVLDAMGALADEAVSVLADLGRTAGGDPAVTQQLESQLDILVTTNHALLEAIGVSHPALTSVVSTAERHGFAAKLTGAGGGGCAIIILPSTASDDAVAALTAELGALATHDTLPVRLFRTTVGAPGVRFE